MTYQEYQNWQSRIDECEDREVIPFGPFAGRCIDWDCELNSDQRAVAHQVAYDRYYQRMEDNAIEQALAARGGCLSEAYEDRWPEA